MDIHKEVDNMVASITQPSQLRFEFHSNGCIVYVNDAAGEHKHELTSYDLMCLNSVFRMGDDHHIIKMMQAGTVVYFTEHKEQV